MTTASYITAALMLAVTIAIGFAMKEGQGPLEPKHQRGVVTYVCDGDSLTLRGGRKCGVRLWGVDAPEKGQNGSEGAKIALQRMADKQPVTYINIDTDRYGRTVARVFLKDGREINRMMIESGAAKEYLRYSKGFYSR